jgi:hypothetical protein
MNLKKLFHRENYSELKNYSDNFPITFLIATAKSKRISIVDLSHWLKQIDEIEQAIPEEDIKAKHELVSLKKILLSKSSFTPLGNILRNVIAVLFISIISFFVMNMPRVLANANPAEDKAFYMEMLSYMKTAAEWASVVGDGITAINTNLNAVSDVMSNGLNSLFDMENEKYNNLQVTTGTGLEAVKSTIERFAMLGNELANGPGSSACVADAFDGGLAAILWGRTTITNGDSITTSGAFNGFDNGNPALNSVSSGNDVLEDIKKIKEGDNSLADSFNGSPIQGGFVTGSKEEEIRDKQYNRTIIQPSKIVAGNHDKFENVTGKEFTSDITARNLRRSSASGAILWLKEGERADPGVYTLLEKTLKDIQTDTTSDSSPDDYTSQQATVFNTRLAAFAKEGERQLKLEKFGGDNKAMSLYEMMDYRVSTKSSSAYSEFVRSSGPSPTPLLREVIDNQIIMMMFAGEQLKLERLKLKVLAATLLDQQDDPRTVSDLQKLRSRALK